LLIWSAVDGKTNQNEQTKGANMFSINRIFFAGAVVSAVAAALMASGCAAGGGMNRAAEVRVATTLEGATPKMIVSGPARLLHVDVHGRQSLNVYSVKRGADGNANCGDAVRSEALPLRQGASNELDLVVLEDEAVCLANASGSPRAADVSWHARSGKNAPAETLQAGNF
jgi:hypothetical protein